MDANSDYREILADHVWKHPRDYGGFSPDGDYVIVTRNRESSALGRSNYRRIFADLGATSYDERDEENRPPVYDFRAGHWACGWVEYLLVRHDAPESVLIQAAEIVCALADYPVYDESDFSELEWTEATEYWARCSVRDRLDYIRDSQCGCSIFAARHDYLPADDNGSLFERLTSN